MVFNDAVVHQGHAARAVGLRPAHACAEVRMRVVHHRRAVRSPAGVGNAGAAFKVVGAHLFQQLGHARRAAGALQSMGLGAIAAAAMHGNAAGIVAPVFQPLQALDQDGNDVAR